QRTVVKGHAARLVQTGSDHAYFVHTSIVIDIGERIDLAGVGRADEDRALVAHSHLAGVGDLIAVHRHVETGPRLKALERRRCMGSPAHAQKNKQDGWAPEPMAEGTRHGSDLRERKVRAYNNAALKDGECRRRAAQRPWRSRRRSLLSCRMSRLSCRLSRTSERMSRCSARASR